MSVDLTTDYLGLTLRNPLVASSSPLTGNLDSLLELEAAGAAAVVCPSLFEEQIEHEELQVHQLYEFQAESNAESLTLFPELQEYNTGPREYLQQLDEAKQKLSIPVIGSLNGSSLGGWVEYAKAIQDTGVDALELNIYFVPTDPHMSGAEVEQRYIDLVASVRQSVTIPLAVKIGQNFSNLTHFAGQLVSAGADALVLFNRFLEADIDLELLQFQPDLVLSNRHEARTPIRWIAILRDQVEISLAATSGVHRVQGIVKLLLAGADVTMMASILLKKGPSYLGTLLQQLHDWLEEHEYDSVRQLQGSMSRINCPNPGALERANYMKTLISYSTGYQY